MKRNYKVLVTDLTLSEAKKLANVALVLFPDSNRDVDRVIVTDEPDLACNVTREQKRRSTLTPTNLY